MKLSRALIIVLIVTAYPIRSGLMKIANDAAHESLYTLMKAFLQK